MHTKTGESANKQPVISEETKREMAKFFMKTSIPRILEEKRKMAEKQVQKEA